MPAYDEFPWFRLWNRFVDDESIMAMPPDIFKTWVVCLAIASRNKTRGRLPQSRDKVGTKFEESQNKVRTKSEQSQNKVRGKSEQSPDKVLTLYPESWHIARAMNAQIPATNRRIEVLIGMGLIDRDDEGLKIHNWEEYQPPRDTNAERQRRYREANKRESEGGMMGAPGELQGNPDNVHRNGDHNVTSNGPRVTRFRGREQSQRKDPLSPPAEEDSPHRGATPQTLPPPLPLPPFDTDDSIAPCNHKCLDGPSDARTESEVSPPPPLPPPLPPPPLPPPTDPIDSLNHRDQECVHSNCRADDPPPSSAPLAGMRCIDRFNAARMRHLAHLASLPPSERTNGVPAHRDQEHAGMHNGNGFKDSPWARLSAPPVAPPEVSARPDPVELMPERVGSPPEIPPPALEPESGPPPSAYPTPGSFPLQAPDRSTARPGAENQNPGTPPPLPPAPPPPAPLSHESLHEWAEGCLGDRYELENVGPNIRAWVLSGFTPERVRDALTNALAKAGHGSLVRYALGCLKTPDREPASSNTPYVVKSEAVSDAFRKRAEEKRRLLAESSVDRDTPKSSKSNNPGDQEDELSPEEREQNARLDRAWEEARKKMPWRQR